MESPPLVPVILSGGSGTRLWPVSRHHSPKQLEALVGDRSMLAATVDRLEGLDGLASPIIVCNVDHGPAVRREVRRSHRPDATVVLEPVARNTAPAVAAAAMLVDDDPILLVMPADHVIADTAEFHRMARVGAAAAADGALVTFGIVPTHPATGYGYIRSTGSDDVRPVDAFVEKPDVATAAEFVASGDYLWNSGMFIFRATSYLAELAIHEPEMVTATRNAIELAGHPVAGVVQLDAEAFAESPSTSIDYAVMERTDRAVVIPLQAGWSDVGLWSSLREVGENDEAGNVTVGDVLTLDVSGSYLRSEGMLLTVLGLSGVVAVVTPDAVLLAAEDRVEDVKGIVEELRRRGRPEADVAALSTSDWGSVQVLSRGDGTVVEQITLDARSDMRPAPGTWVVMSGSGTFGGADYAPGTSFIVDDSAGMLSSGDQSLEAIRVGSPAPAGA